MPVPIETAIRRAAEAIDRAEAILIAAGAGMGVDSGLPDFRGPEGFWRAYPPYRRLGYGFQSLASPRWFREDPALAWGFYGHRLATYRATVPHPGFAILKRWADQMPLGWFVYTSNVDGQFQRAGFDPGRIFEVHGAIERMQCVLDCGAGIFPADAAEVAVDPETMRAIPPLPSCPRCGELARPNILLFGDGQWDHSVMADQVHRLKDWLGSLRGGRLVVVECGAGTAIPTVRNACGELAEMFEGTLVRINPGEPQVGPGNIGIALGALDGLRAIQDALRGRPD